MGLYNFEGAVDAGLSAYEKQKALRRKLASDEWDKKKDQSLMDYQAKEGEAKTTDADTKYQSAFGQSKRFHEMGENLFMKGYDPKDTALSPESRKAVEGYQEWKDRLATKSDPNREHQNWELDDVNNSIKGLDDIQAHGIELKPEQVKMREDLYKKRAEMMKIPYTPPATDASGDSAKAKDSGGFWPTVGKGLSAAASGAANALSGAAGTANSAAKGAFDGMKSTKTLSELIKEEQAKRKNK